MPRGHWCVPVLSAARHSAGGAEERNAPQPEGIDGPRRARRQLRLLPLLSTMALMKAIIKRKPAILEPMGFTTPASPRNKPGTMLHSPGLRILLEEKGRK